jgi:hypothetical protein
MWMMLRRKQQVPFGKLRAGSPLRGFAASVGMTKESKRLGSA